ncbi:MAG: hypothetical protein IPF82_15775 [Blastocatellia bacterium]|nr:hypothetical protein [Blastocatellia bacterium]
MTRWLNFGPTRNVVVDRLLELEPEEPGPRYVRVLLDDRDDARRVADSIEDVLTTGLHARRQCDETERSDDDQCDEAKRRALAHD